MKKNFDILVERILNDAASRENISDLQSSLEKFIRDASYYLKTFIRKAPYNYRNYSIKNVEIFNKVHIVSPTEDIFKYLNKTGISAKLDNNQLSIAMRFEYYDMGGYNNSHTMVIYWNSDTKILKCLLYVDSLSDCLVKNFYNSNQVLKYKNPIESIDDFKTAFKDITNWIEIKEDLYKD